MVRNFRGQVKIADVQAEFDALIAKINTDIEEYNTTITKDEDIDFTHGSPSLSGSGYCLTVGGLKKLLAAYNGTMMGAKPFRNSAGDTLVTAGIYIDSTGCKTTRGQLVNQIGRHLYFDPSSNTFSISNDANMPSTDGWAGASMPAQNSNTGDYYTFSINSDNDDLKTPDASNAYKALKVNGSEGYQTQLSNWNGANNPTVTPNWCCSFTNPDIRIFSGSDTQRWVFNWQFKLKFVTSEIQALLGIEGLSSPRFIVYSSLLDPTKDSGIVRSDYTEYLPINEMLDGTIEADGVTVTTEGEYTVCSFAIQRNYANFNGVLRDLDGAGDIRIGVHLGASSVPSSGLSNIIQVNISDVNVSNFQIFGSVAPSGICDMNPNRTYPYLKTIHNTELYNLRTNKIITESRNLTNGSKKSCTKIANETWTADDNKNESIFVSYNARASNDGQPNPPVYLNIEGLRNNFNMGTRFTHGSSTSACYRFPKFFFLPKGCRSPFSTTDINTARIRYNKYKCEITQKK